MNTLVTQIVRTVMQFGWAFLGSLGIDKLLDYGEVEALLTAAVTAVLLAALSWAERKLPWLGRLFVFAKPPSYE